MVNMMEDAEQYLHINKDSLDEELIQQPSLYFSVAERYAIAVSRRDEAYDNIKLVDAELYQEIRSAAEQSGTKVTEATINAQVMAHPTHQQAVQNHLELKLEADKLGALKEAVSQRSYMLRDLVELYLAGYYHTSSVPDRRDRQNSKASALENKVREGRRRLNQ